MPRYFIDLHDGAHYVKDKVGFELADETAVRGKLARIMAKIAQEFSLDTERQDYLAIVRDESAGVLYRAHLSLDIEKVDRTPEAPRDESRSRHVDTRWPDRCVRSLGPSEARIGDVMRVDLRQTDAQSRRSRQH